MRAEAIDQIKKSIVKTYGRRGEAVVLVHGSMGDYRTWVAQVPELSRHYRVFNLSLPRYYPEKWNGAGEGFGIIEHARAVAEFTKALQLGKVHLIGHSRGGAVALKVATYHPEVIKTLVLADPSGMENLLPETPESQQLLEQSRFLRKNLIDAIRRGEPEKGAEEFTDALGVPGTWKRRTPCAAKSRPVGLCFSLKHKDKNSTAA